MITKLKIWIIMKIVPNHGPLMIPVKDYWLFVDINHRIWKIKWTGQYDIPLSIELWER